MQHKRSFFTYLSRSFLLSSALVFSLPAWAEKVIDIVGREVELPKKVDRILLGEGRLFHAVSLLEGDQPLARIVGWQGDFRKLDTQSYAMYKAKFPEIDDIPLVGNTTSDSISAERVLMLNPDIAIFGLSGHGPGRSSELVNQLEKSGVPVVFVDFRSYPLKNTIPSMQILGKALKREEVAERYIQFYQDNVKKVTDITDSIPEDKKPTVFIDLRAGMSDSCCNSAGNGNMGDFIDLAGGNNMAKDLLPGILGAVNLEKIIVVDPDVYILTGGKAVGTGPGVVLGPQATSEQTLESAKPLLARNGINSLKAVTEGRAYAVWHNYYNSPQNVLVVQAFAKWFYPELFKDLDPEQTQKALHNEFLAVEPTGTMWLDLNK